jgi:sialidase-1
MKMVVRQPWLTTLMLLLEIPVSSALPPDPATVYAWFKGDAGVEMSGSIVTNWQNQATTGSPASRNLNRLGGFPQQLGIVTTNGMLNVVRFSGSANLYATVGTFGSLADDRTVVIRCRLTSTNGGFLFDGSSNSGLTRAQVRDGYWQVGVQPDGQGAAADPDTLPATSGEWQTHVFGFSRLTDGTQITHSIPGEGSVTYTNTFTNQLSGFIIGENVAEQLGLAVDVAEVLVYDQLLDAPEQQAVSEYLAAKWTVPPPAPMSYLSSTTAQTPRTVANFGLHDVLDLQVVAQGQTNPIALTNIVVTTTGTTDPDDIAGLKIFYTENSGVFVSRQLFASYSGAMTNMISLAGSQALVEGVNHFWVAFEPKRTAKWGNHLDAEVVSVAVNGPNGGVKTPDITAPPGFLTLGNIYCSTVLYRLGENGAHSYEIPGLAVTTNGTLIAVFDVRWDSANDLPANIDVGCMRSTDNGNTWSPMQPILDFDKNADPYGNGVGDPCILVDRQTGAIWVAGLWSYGSHGGNYESGTGLSTNETGQYVLTRSDDDGLTWSPPINITAQAKVDTNWGAVFQGPGNGIQLRDGTLVFPSQYDGDGRVGSGSKYQPRSFFIYSTNHGALWLTSPPANSVPPKCNENQLVELNTGQIMASMRNYAGLGQRAWATYTRGTTPGNGTWSGPTFTNLDPICQASFIRYSSTLDGHPRDRMLFANPASSDPNLREKMTIRMSEDEGQSWPVSREIDSRPAGYSCMAVLNDGTVGIVYMTGDSLYWETLTFVRFSMDWLTQADVDSDNDGMSDHYEEINGLNQSGNDANEDKDGDGMNNLREFRSGTMANDPQSVLRIRSISYDGGTLQLTWSSVPWTSYSVEKSSAAGAGGWTPVPGAQEIMATSATTSVSVVIGPGSDAFYRIKALSPY